MNIDAVNQFIGSEWEHIHNDCFAVFRKASKAVFGRDIPAIDLPEVSTLKGNEEVFIREASGEKWKKVAAPSGGDAVLFYGAKDRPIHIGLYIENGFVLHCPGSPAKPLRTVYEQLKCMNRFVYRRFEYYRPCI